MARIAPFNIHNTIDEYLKQIVFREVHRYNRGCMITIAGSTHRKTGTGKSWTALKIGEYNDKDYTKNADKVVYFAKDFMKVMDKIEESKRYGQVAVLDEAGSLVASNQWQSIVNKTVSYTAQTFRYLRATLVLVMPQRRLIDKNVRTMADYHITMESALTARGLVYLSTPYALKFDEFNDETYRQSLYARLVQHKNRLVKLRRVPVTPVLSQGLIDDYENKSIAFKRQLREMMAEDVEAYEKQIKKSMPALEIEKVSNTLSRDEDFISSIVRNRKIDADLLAYNLQKNLPDYNFSSKDISLIKKHMSKGLGGL